MVSLLVDTVYFQTNLTNSNVFIVSGMITMIYDFHEEFAVLFVLGTRTNIIKIQQAPILSTFFAY